MQKISIEYVDGVSEEYMEADIDHTNRMVLIHKNGKITDLVPFEAILHLSIVI